MSFTGLDQLGDHRESLRLLARAKLPAFLWAKVDPSDLVHDTLFEAQRTLDQFNGTEKQFGAWLKRVLLNNVKDVISQYHAQRRNVLLEKSLRELEELLTSSDDSPSWRILHDEKLTSLATALAQLPADQQDAVELKHLQGLCVAEIAARMKRSEVAVAGLLRRGLQRLRELMPEPV